MEGWIPINGVPKSRTHHEVVYQVNQESPSDKEKSCPNMSLSTSLEPSVRGQAGSWGTRESSKPRKRET